MKKKKIILMMMVLISMAFVAGCAGRPSECKEEGKKMV